MPASWVRVNNSRSRTAVGNISLTHRRVWAPPPVLRAPAPPRLVRQTVHPRDPQIMPVKLKRRHLSESTTAWSATPPRARALVKMKSVDRRICGPIFYIRKATKPPREQVLHTAAPSHPTRSKLY